MQTRLSGGAVQQQGGHMYSSPVAGHGVRVHVPMVTGTAYPMVMSSAPRFSMQGLPSGYVMQSNNHGPMVAPTPGYAYVPIARPSGGLIRSQSQGSILRAENNLEMSPQSGIDTSPVHPTSLGDAGPHPLGESDPQSQFVTRNLVQRTTRRPISPMPLVPIQQQMPAGALPVQPGTPIGMPHQAQVPLQAQFHMQQQQAQPNYIASPVHAHQAYPAVRLPSQLSLVGHFPVVQGTPSGMESPTSTKQVTERAYTVQQPNEPPMSVHEVTTREEIKREKSAREDLESQLRQRVQSLEEALKSVEKGSQDTLKELMDYQDIKEQLKRAQNRLRELEHAHENCDRDKESLRARIRQLEDSHQTGDRDKDDLRARIRELEDAREKCERDKESLQTRIRDLENDPTVGDLQRRNAELKQDLEDALQRLRDAKDWQDQLRSNEAQIEVLEREIDLLRRERDDAGGCAREMEKQLTELRMELDTLRGEQWAKIHEQRALDKSLVPPIHSPVPPAPPAPATPPSTRSDPMDNVIVPPHRPLASKRDPSYFAAEGRQCSGERAEAQDDGYAGGPAQYRHVSRAALGSGSSLYHTQPQHQRLPVTPPPAALPQPPERSTQALETSMLHHSPKMKVNRGPDLYPATHKLQADTHGRNGSPQDVLLRPMRPTDPTNTDCLNREQSVAALRNELSSMQQEYRLHRELQHGISRTKNALNKI